MYGCLALNGWRGVGGWGLVVALKQHHPRTGSPTTILTNQRNDVCLPVHVSGAGRLPSWESSMSMEGGATEAEDENPCCVSDMARLALGFSAGPSSGGLHKMVPWANSASSDDDRRVKVGLTPSPPLSVPGMGLGGGVPLV